MTSTGWMAEARRETMHDANRNALGTRPFFKWQTELSSASPGARAPSHRFPVPIDKYGRGPALLRVGESGMSKADEAALVRALAEGREEAFAAVYDRYAPALFRVAWTL